MDELARLSAELRQELGDPPDALPGAVFAKARLPAGSAPAGLARPGVSRWIPARPALFAAAMLTLGVAALVLAVGLDWRAAGLGWRGVQRASDGWEDSVWLAAETTRGPYRLPDGSTIELMDGARGRLVLTEAGAHFDLHAGRAVFDVVPRPHQRWVVAAGELEVLVLGTRFSVALGPRESVEVRVERGSVAVRAPGRQVPIHLAVGERLESDGTKLTIEPLGTVAADERSRAAAPAAALAAGSAAPPASAASASSEVAAPDWRALYGERRYPLALARAKALGFERLIREADAQTLAELADVARLGGDPALAVTCLVALERRFPASPPAAEARFLLGRVYAVQGNRVAASAAFEDYLRRSPGGSYASEALGRLMELYSARGERSRAEAVARRYLERTPDGPYRQLARSLIERR